MEELLIALLIIVVFLVCREIVCWYWKINKAVNLLEEMKDSLERLVRQGK